MKSFLPTLWEPERAGAAPMNALRREMDRLFDAFATPIWPGGSNGDVRLWPAVDMAQTEKETVLTFDLPGVDPKDVEVSLSGSTLTVRGEKKTERDEKKASYQVTERAFGRFERMIDVDEGVDPGKVKAEFAKGVLKITLARPADAQPARHKIEIKAAA